jgi:hypothetical protein
MYICILNTSKKLSQIQQMESNVMIKKEMLRQQKGSDYFAY